MLILATLIIGTGVIYSSIPEDPEAIYQVAYDGLKYQSATAKQFTEALTKLRAYPEYASHVLFLEGALAAAKTRDPKALELFAKAAENPKIRPVVMQSVGRSRTRMGDFKGGIEAYEETIKLDTELANETRVLLSRLYYVVAAKKLAEDVLTKVIEDEPKNENARQQLATICADFNRHAEAVEHQSHLLSSVGDFSAANPEFIQTYAMNLIKADDQTRLKELSESYLDFINDPGITAMVQIAVGKTEEVMTGLKGAIQSEMATIDMQLAYANTALQAGPDPRVEDLIIKLVDVAPRNLDVWKTAAKMYKVNQQADKLAVAEANVQQLTELNDKYLQMAQQVADDMDDIQGRMEVAGLLIEKGDLNDAMVWYEMAQMLEPTLEIPGLEDVEKLAKTEPLVPFAVTEANEDQESTEEVPAKAVEAEDKDPKEETPELAPQNEPRK